MSTPPGATVDQARLQTALAASADGHGPGLLGLVTDDGRTVFEGSVGVADLAAPRPPRATDQFRIGSVTKTYVSALVLQLVADGVIGLTDTVSRWLPGAVPDSDGITVELLLRMRSGLPDYVEQVFGDPPDLGALDRYWSPADLLGAALRGRGRGAPDQAFRYCNTDYILLGLIVERATGETVEAQLWQRIFEPLQLAGTTFPTVDPRLRGPHARGHLRASAASPYDECTVLTPSEAWTAGAIVSTPADVATFFEALFTGRVVDAAGLALMTDCSQYLDAQCSRGIGLVRYDWGDGVIGYGHHGGVPGFTTVALRTTTGRCVVLCQNGLDMHDILTRDTPFVRAAVSG